MHERYFTLKEVGSLLRVEPTTAAQYVREGRLQGFRTAGGKKILVAESEVRRFLRPVNVKGAK
jgi:excisionase family DNA binding protein